MTQYIAVEYLKEWPWILTSLLRFIRGSLWAVCEEYLNSTPLQQLTLFTMSSQCQKSLSALWPANQFCGVIVLVDLNFKRNCLIFNVSHWNNCFPRRNIKSVSPGYRRNLPRSLNGYLWVALSVPITATSVPNFVPVKKAIGDL